MEKCLEGTFQFVHYVVCIWNVKMTERKESFPWGKQLLRHPKLEFCIANSELKLFNLFKAKMLSSNFIIFTVHNNWSQQNSLKLFLVSLVLGIFVILVIFASSLKRIAARIDWLILKSSRKPWILDTCIFSCLIEGEGVKSISTNLLIYYGFL